MTHFLSRFSQHLETSPFILDFFFANVLLNKNRLFIQINPFWKNLRDFLKEPSQYQVDCQNPKPVLLSTGEMFDPYAWAVRLLVSHFCE